MHRPVTFAAVAALAFSSTLFACGGDEVCGRGMRSSPHLSTRSRATGDYGALPRTEEDAGEGVPDLRLVLDFSAKRGDVTNADGSSHTPIQLTFRAENTCSAPHDTYDLSPPHLAAAGATFVTPTLTVHGDRVTLANDVAFSCPTADANNPCFELALGATPRRNAIATGSYETTLLGGARNESFTLFVDRASRIATMHSSAGHDIVFSFDGRPYATWPVGCDGTPRELLVSNTAPLEVGRVVFSSPALVPECEGNFIDLRDDALEGSDGGTLSASCSGDRCLRFALKP